MAVPYTFAGQTGPIPLTQLDVNFATIPNYANTAGTVTTNAQPNITSVGTLTALSVAGGITGTLLSSAQPSITQVGTLNGLSISGNLAVSGNIVGNANISGNITGSNLSVGLITGTLTTVAQPNITSVGNLSTLNVTGNTNGSNLNLSGNLLVLGNAYIAGTTTFVNSTSLNVGDLTIVVANGASTSATIDGAGIEAGNPTVAYIKYSHASTGWTTANNFSIGGNLAVTGTITTTTVSNATANTQVATTEFVRNIIPSGVITLWYGLIANIPDGWYLCDGGNGTPNLTDRFVLGAGNAYTSGQTGGSADAIVVAHNHSAIASSTSVVTDPGHAHQQADNSSVNIFGGGGGGSGGSRGGSGLFTYSAYTGISVATTTTVTNAVTGSPGTDANLPPYYALAYIMKA